MARDTGPQCKQCRREGQKLFLKGERCLTEKCGVERRSYPPGEHGRGRMRQSEYRQQLREKQKARRYYQVLEKQFRSYYEKASRQQGITGENLLRLLERRLDNVLVRLGFAASRRQARQLIRHGHWLVNGRRVDIPSYQVRPDDVISIRPDSKAADVVRSATELTAAVPPWLQADHDSLTAKVLRLPERGEITDAGRRAADRRALLQVGLATTERQRPEEAMTTLPEFQIPKISSEKVADNRGTSRSSPSTRASATRSATACAACCSRRWAARRSRACGSRAWPTSSRPSPG